MSATQILPQRPLVKLGSTDLHVSRLSLGGLFVSAMGGGFDNAKGAVNRALALGVNYIDTAPGYANSEEVLGQILKGHDKPLILSTKLGGRPQPFLPQDKDCLMKSFEESLRLLGRDTIDILMIHEPDRPLEYDWFTDWENVHGPVVDFLSGLKRQGLIRYTGLGGTTAYQMAHIIRKGDFDVLLTAFNYSLLWREAAIELIPAAIEKGMGIVVGSPLQQGALAKRYDDDVRNGALWMSKPRRAQFLALYDYLDQIQMPITEVAIRFVISNPAIHSVLMGAATAEQVDSNFSAVQKGALPESILNELSKIADMVPFRPCEEPFCLPFTRPAKGPGNAWNW